MEEQLPIKPAGNYLILDVKKKENTSSIILVEKRVKKEAYGTIKAIGDYVDIPLNIGDKVFFTTGGTKDTEFGLFVPERSLTLK